MFPCLTTLIKNGRGRNGLREGAVLEESHGVTQPEETGLKYISLRTVLPSRPQTTAHQGTRQAAVTLHTLTHTADGPLGLANTACQIPASSNCDISSKCPSSSTAVVPQSTDGRAAFPEAEQGIKVSTLST